MRNCSIISSKLIKSVENTEPVRQVFWDEIAGQIYSVTSSMHLEICSIKSGEFSNVSLSELVQPDDEVIDLSSIIQYERIITLVTRKGEIVSIPTDTLAPVCEGSIEFGILAAAWSPSQERLALVTTNATLLLLDNTFNPLNEVPIDPDQPPEEKLEIFGACVAWTQDSKTISTLFSLGENQKTKCVTRDASNLASLRSPGKSDPPGGLVQSVAEVPVENLKTFGRWKPDGSLLTGVENDMKKTDKIVFWEKNGLRHGETTLPNAFLTEKESRKGENMMESSILSGKFKISSLEWNKTCELLAVNVVYEAADGIQNYTLLLTRHNYVWYAKRVIRSMSNQKVIGCKWSSKSPYLLTVSLENGFTEFLEFRFEITSGFYSKEKEATIVALENFESVGVTPITVLGIPPPMTHKSVLLNQNFDPKTILDLTLEKSLLGVLTNSGLFIFRYTWEKIEFVSWYKFDVSSDSRPRNLTIVLREEESENKENVSFSESSPLFCAFLSENAKLNLLKCTNEAKLPASEPGKIESISFSTSKAAKDVHSLFKDKGCLYLHLQDHSIVRIDLSAPLDKEPDTIGAIPAFCIKLSMLGSVPMGLTKDSSLYYGEHLVAKDCTSFEVHQILNLVFFTCIVPGCYDVLYAQSKEQLMAASLPEPDGKNPFVRKVERGSTIVALSREKLVFELPRGNIETIQPRILTLTCVRELVDKEMYGRAFTEIKKNKMDMNLLVDLHPEKFLGKIDHFVKELSSPENISLFLAELKDQICPEIQYILSQEERAARSFPIQGSLEYSKTLKNDGTLLSEEVKGKVTMICHLIRESLEKQSNPRLIFSIMVTYAKSSPPELYEGLQRIGSLQHQAQSAHGQTFTGAAQLPPHMNPKTGKKYTASGDKGVTARQALEYFCWLVDAEQLYSVALQTYDLDLAIIVAEHTKRDPKEYLPYIQSLREISNEGERQLKICMDMKKPEKAIVVLEASLKERAIDKAIDIILDYNLYTQGLKVFAPYPKCVSIISRHFAEFLKKKSEIKQAVLHYQAAGMIPEAMDCYRLMLDWKGAFGLACAAGFTQEEKEKVLYEFSDILEKASHKSKAGKLLLLIGNKKDRKKALDLIAEGQDWRLLKKNIVLGLEEEHRGSVQSELELAASLYRNELVDRLKDYSEKKKRLLNVQEKKRSFPLMGVGQNGGQGEFDLASDYSGGSRASSSNRTGSKALSVATGLSSKSKNTRRPKNIMSRNVKEGSPYEEDWLVEKLNSAQKEISNEEWLGRIGHLVDLLVMFGMIEAASGLLRAFKAFYDAVPRFRLWKTLRQIDFEKLNQDIYDIYPNVKEFMPYEEGGKAEKHEPAEKKFLLKYANLLQLSF